MFSCANAYSNDNDLDQNETKLAFNFKNNPIEYNKNSKFKVQPNFVSHYIVSTYGCGGGAICGSIEDVYSNKVIGFPNAYLIEDENGDNEFSVVYHLNSSMIVISGILADLDEKQDKDGFKARYYQIINDKLILLGKL